MRPFRAGGRGELAITGVLEISYGCLERIKDI